MQDMYYETVPKSLFLHLPQVAMATVRVATHSGVGVTVYVVEGEPLFFEEEGRIYPTGT